MATAEGAFGESFPNGLGRFLGTEFRSVWRRRFACGFGYRKAEQALVPKVDRRSEPRGSDPERCNLLPEGSGPEWRDGVPDLPVTVLGRTDDRRTEERVRETPGDLAAQGRTAEYSRDRPCLPVLAAAVFVPMIKEVSE
jgi:hypothetical protein